MMSEGSGRLSVNIAGSFVHGHGITCHTIYKLNIISSEGNWSIYRRYSEFHAFHSELMGIFGQETFARINAEFPEKAIGGSVGGTVRMVVTYRISAFQGYLNAILSVEEIETHALVTTFLDFANKGISGMQRLLGPSKILRETFAKVKVNRNHLIGFWGTSFIVLLKTGTLLVNRSMYESNMAKSLVNMNLTSGQVYFLARPDNTLEISSIASASAPAGVAVPNNTNNAGDDETNSMWGGNNVQLFLKFDSPADSAFWLRTIADLVTSTARPTSSASASSINGSSSRSGGNGGGSSRKGSFSFSPSSWGFGTGGGESQKKASRSASLPPEQVFRDKGTGNTKDELSSMYGL